MALQWSARNDHPLLPRVAHTAQIQLELCKGQRNFELIWIWFVISFRLGCSGLAVRVVVQAGRSGSRPAAPRKVAPEEECRDSAYLKDVYDGTHGQRAWVAPAAGIQCRLRTNVHSLSPNAPLSPSSSRRLVRTRLGQTRASRRMTSLFTSRSPVGTKPSRS
jgi:hypothetical protein